MLNGVGGRTIAEAKRRLSYDELRTWLAYIEKHGSLHVGRRLEYGFAQVASLIHGAHYKGQKSISDFMPHYRPPEPKPGSINDVMKILSGGK